MDDTSYWIKVPVVILFLAVGLWCFRSQRKAWLAARATPPANAVPLTPQGDAPRAAQEKNLLHGMLSYPGFGPLFATFLGLILPFFLYAVFVPVPKRYVMVGLGLAISIWNLFLVRIFRVRIGLPIIPIPLWIVGILISGYGFYEVISGTA